MTPFYRDERNPTTLCNNAPGLCKEGADQMRLLSQAPDGEVEFLVHLLQVPAHQVAHLDILQGMPPALVPGVEVGGVSRQGLQPHTNPHPRHEPPEGGTDE